MDLNKMLVIKNIQYMAKKLIGTGQDTCVYEAVDCNNYEKVALKIISKYKKNKQRADNEIKIQSSLNSNNIIKIIAYQVNDIQDKIYIVIELGKMSIQDKLKRNFPFSLRQFFMILFDISEGLAYIHGKGIIHHDIKLSNIILSLNGKGCKIADFGISTYIQQKSKLRQGSYQYYSPQKLKQNQDTIYTQKTDVWSYGIAIFIALFEFHPFYYGPSEVSMERYCKQMQKNMKIFQSGFTIPKLEKYLRANKFDKLANKIYLFMEELPNQFLQMFEHIFQLDPNKRYTMDEILTKYIHKIKEKEQIMIPKNFFTNQSRNQIHNQLIKDINDFKLPISTINMFYELQFLYPFINHKQVQKCLQMALYFANCAIYHDKLDFKFSEKNKIEDSVFELNKTQQLWHVIQITLIDYYLYLTDNKQKFRLVFQKIEKLRYYSLICAFWVKIRCNDKKICKFEKVRGIANFKDATTIINFGDTIQGDQVNLMADVLLDI